MSIREFIKKSTVANVVAGFLVIAGMMYAIWTKNTQLVSYLCGAGTGFLLKELKERS